MDIKIILDAVNHFAFDYYSGDEDQGNYSDAHDLIEDTKESKTLDEVLVGLKEWGVPEDEVEIFKLEYLGMTQSTENGQ